MRSDIYNDGRMVVILHCRRLWFHLRSYKFLEKSKGKEKIFEKTYKMYNV